VAQVIPQPHNLASLRAAWQASEGLHREEVPRRPCFSLENAAGDEPVRLYVNGLIGGYDLDATEFVKTVHAITAATIYLHINSPGGFVWDAMSMLEALRSHPATVRAHVDGLAGSAASFLAMAGDSIETAPGSRWVIHDAQSIAIGSPADLREAADLADEVSNDIAGLYASRAGGEPAAWRAAMTAVTTYGAQQAVDAGLADRVSGTPEPDPEPEPEPEDDAAGDTESKTSGASNLVARTLRARAAVALGRGNL
jgi:ATP-dependent protease ClpP protease subunit